MAGDDAERVGGISVGVDVTEGGLEGQLRAIENRLKAAAERYQSILTLSVNAATQQGQQGQPSRQQEAQQSRQRARASADAEVSEARRSQREIGAIEAQRIQYVDGIEKQRRRAARGQEATPIDVDRGEASRWRQRAREEAQVKREVTQQKRLRTKEEDQRALKELSYEAENSQVEQAPSMTLVNARRTPEQIAAFRREAEQRTAQQRNATPEERAAEERARRQRGAPATVLRREAGGREEQHALQRQQEMAAAAVSSAAARQRAAVSPRAKESLGEAVERINRRFEDEVQRSISSITASGRTGQVAASGIAAGQFGTRFEGIRASAEQRAARRLQEEASKRLRINPRDIEAQDLLTRSTERLAVANQRLNSLQGFPATVRNLAAIAGGALLFSRAMSAVDPILQASSEALGNWLDLQSGFATRSSRVTSALAQQTIAQRGNVEAVLAQAAATAGLSEATTDYLGNSIKMTTQVKAGALAAAQASDLFRAQQGLQGGRTPEGLAGGFGGVLGTSFLGQQLGGGKGFSEIIGADIRGLTGQPNTDQFQGAIDSFNTGVTFLVNEGFRNFVADQAKTQGSPIGGATDIAGRGFAVAGQFAPPAIIANLLTGNFNPVGTVQNAINPPPAPEVGAGSSFDPTAGIDPQNLELLRVRFDDLNSSAERGRDVLGGMGKATIDFAKAGAAGEEEIRKATQAAIAARNYEYLAQVNTSKVIIRLNGEVADTAQELNDALQQMAVGQSIPDPATLGRLSLANERQRQREAAASIPAQQAQFAYERPAFMANLERQQQFAINTQLPAQAALQNLAQPLLPVGTGIVAANADEQERIEASTKRTTELQDQLNAYYKRGEAILTNTYQIPQQLVGSIRAVGQEIASVQAGIRDNQAEYQVAQYNYQLRIARRSLTDIRQVTGEIGTVAGDNLGLYERENLLLSRQAQLLQFGMQQRQINFQVALAGFQAPGVTPEERQARVKEAQIEADYAQKQLNIQRQMFGNQVQIVDIQNLRQGADLAAQIGLLLQGRQVTIDTAAAEEKLIRLQQLQAQQVAEAGTYIEKTNAIVARVFGEIQSLETAAGRAMYNAATYAMNTFGVYIAGIYAQLTSFASSIGGQQTETGWGGHAPGRGPLEFAEGGLFNVNSPTGITVGEAGNETVAILSNPRAMSGTMAGSGGGDISIVFSGDITVRNSADIDEIAQKVAGVINRDAAIRGLRSPN